MFNYPPSPWYFMWHVRVFGLWQLLVEGLEIVSVLCFYPCPLQYMGQQMDIYSFFSFSFFSTPPTFLLGTENAVGGVGPSLWCNLVCLQLLLSSLKPSITLHRSDTILYCSLCIYWCASCLWRMWYTICSVAVVFVKYYWSLL